MTTTKEQVLKAAQTSPQAKEALKELFPDAFKMPQMIKYDITDSILINARRIAPKVSGAFMNVMNWGNHSGDATNKRSFYLSQLNCDTRWEIINVGSAFEKCQILKPVEYKES